MTLHLREYIAIPYTPGYGLCICPKCVCKTVVDCFVHICDYCLTDNDDGTCIAYKKKFLLCLKLSDTIKAVIAAKYMPQ